jgi:hypothetical protein
VTTLSIQSKKPVELLSKHLFWDIDPNVLEWERSKKTIIERVIERGNLEEWVCIVKVYTLEGIVNTAKTFRTMSPIDLNFIATISNTPKEEFRCYNTRLLTGQHWIY